MFEFYRCFSVRRRIKSRRASYRWRTSRYARCRTPRSRTASSSTASPTRYAHARSGSRHHITPVVVKGSLQKEILERQIILIGSYHCMVMCAVARCQVIKACKTDSEGKVVEGKHHVYRMSAAQPDDKDDCRIPSYNIVSSCCNSNVFFGQLIARGNSAVGMVGRRVRGRASSL